MTSLREAIRRQFEKIQPLPAGIYHYQAPQEDPRNYRLHLRLESDGSGILIVNASTILHLNQTAAEYAFHLVSGSQPEEAAKAISSRYHIPTSDALRDYSEFAERIDAMVSSQQLDPEVFLDFDRQRPHTGAISAPYRLDCALTYRLGLGTDSTAAPLERVSRELNTSEWISILDKAWQAGIPHIVLTGGEPTLRDDLIELIVHAEANGQVTGLLTDGNHLADESYFHELLQSGLDHLMILYNPDQVDVLPVIKHSIGSDLFTSVHITITPDNLNRISNVLDDLAKLGLKSLSLSISNKELASDLVTIRNRSAHLGLNLVWNLPVPYSRFNPVALEYLGQDRPTGGGRDWLYVEPDGDVLVEQGASKVLGNILRDPINEIWKPT